MTYSRNRGPLLDAQDAAYGTGRSAYGPSYDGPDWPCRSVARGCTLLGSAEGSLCVRSEWQTHDDEGGNCKNFHLHDCSFLCDHPTK